MGEILPPGRHLTISGDILAYHLRVGVCSWRGRVGEGGGDAIQHAHTVHKGALTPPAKQIIFWLQ